MSGVSRGTEFSTADKIAAQIEQRRLGKRGNVRHGGSLCSRCLEKPPATPSQAYCAECRNRDRRQWRARRKAEKTQKGEQ